MVSVEDAVIARISRKGVNFEILVDPDLALSMRRGAQVNIENVLAVNDILKDSRKGERHTNEDLHKSFGTTDVFAIAEIIIKEGEIQLTTEQRHKMLEDKKKQIADIISKQGLDPKSKLPHPPLRIMNAMEQAHVHVDPFKPAKEQIKIIVEKIQEVLPISLEKIELAIRVPAEYAGKAKPKPRWTPELMISMATRFAANGYLDDAEKLVNFLIKAKADFHRNPEGLAALAKYFNGKDKQKMDHYRELLLSLYPSSSEAQHLLQLKSAASD